MIVSTRSVYALDIKDIPFLHLGLHFDELRPMKVLTGFFIEKHIVFWDFQPLYSSQLSLFILFPCTDS